MSMTHARQIAKVLDEIRRSLAKNWRGLPYEYSPIVSRKRLKWPKNARLAFWVILNIEHFTTNRPGVSIDPSFAQFKPDVLNYAWRDYSMRVGLWRVMEVLDKHGIRATAALNSSVCKYYPEVVKRCKRRQWEFMGHGVSNSWLLASMVEKDEKKMVSETVDTIKEHTGRAPRGWLGPALAETYKTLEILRENDIDYVCDWCNDDQPYQMNTKFGPMVSMPYSIEINDITLFLQMRFTPREFYEICVDQFETLYKEGRDSGRVMGVALHPFIIGEPFRIRYLDKLLRYIGKKEGVWMATGSEIADWYTGALGRTN
jgi:peptidoglycan/xylan/chitin deacetylase (PgdA/CDA1 family)